MIYAFIRVWAIIFLRLYFRKTIVYGRDHIPEQGPLILASNHPSAFLEAAILTTVMNRPVHFLVRGDMFNPKFQWLFTWTKQIPIYRKKDGITNLRKNASSFDLTYRKLGEGEAVLIFPEAKTILEKKMRPIQRGTAHLAFGTLPFIKNGEQLMIQPVGVNFTEPRLPGTDIVVRFGQPFVTQQATREDRDAIERFTEELSNALSPLIIQVEDSLEKNYDVMASVYFRMIYDNRPGTDAHIDLQKISSFVNNGASNGGALKLTIDILKRVKENKNPNAIYFPDLIVLNRVGLMMLSILKICWLIAGGWIWRLVRYVVFTKIKTNTFQSPTTVGVFMVMMPLVSILLLVVFLITGIPAYYVLVWIFIMWLGALIRPPLDVILKLLGSSGNAKAELKAMVLSLMKDMEVALGANGIK